MILLSAVSLFYLMSFYITKSQTEETLQKNKKESPAVCFSQSLQGTYLIRLNKYTLFPYYFNDESDVYFVLGYILIFS